MSLTTVRKFVRASVFPGRERYRIETECQSIGRPLLSQTSVGTGFVALRNRLLRMILMHTIAVLFNIQDEQEPLQLAHLAA